MNDTIIQAQELTIGFPKLHLFEGESFDIAREKIFAIMGDSGSGKSTLLRCLIGLDLPIAGTVTVNGKPPNVAFGRPTIGVGFQAGALFGSMTVRDNLRLALDAWTKLPMDQIDQLVYAKLALVGVEGVIDRLPSDISGGQVKRVAIARSLMLDPDLIFLDEPFAGLDPITAQELEVLLQRLNGALGVTLVMVSHQVERMVRIADDCLLISSEKRAIVARGKPGDLRKAPPNKIAGSFFGVQEEAA